MTHANRIGLLVVIAASVVILRDGTSIFTFLAFFIGGFMLIHKWGK